MSSAHNAIKLRSSPATSNSIQLEWICSIFRRSASVSSSIDRTWIADAPIVLQGRCEPPPFDGGTKNSSPIANGEATGSSHEIPCTQSDCLITAAPGKNDFLERHPKLGSVAIHI